jgi:hypothetical protein
MLIGYMRVSKADGSQSTNLQRDALVGAGVDPLHLYEDQASGKREDRPGLASCLKALREGDTLAVWKLDRLGRDLRHLRRFGRVRTRTHIGTYRCRISFGACTRQKRRAAVQDDHRKAAPGHGRHGTARDQSRKSLRRDGNYPPDTVSTRFPSGRIATGWREIAIKRIMTYEFYILQKKY